MLKLSFVFCPKLLTPVSNVTVVYGAIRRIKNNTWRGYNNCRANKRDKCPWKNTYQLIAYVWEKEIMLEDGKQQSSDAY
jgi:hypothetical protein